MNAGRNPFALANTKQHAANKLILRKPIGGINKGREGHESLRHVKCGMKVVELRLNIPYEGLAKGDSIKAIRKSRLFRLPQRIRLKIWRDVVTYKEPISIAKHSYSSAWDSNGSCLVRHTWRFSPPLLRTSRRIYQEAGPLFFHCNTFRGVIRNTDISDFIGWVEETDSLLLMKVRSLIINLEPTSFGDVLDMYTPSRGNEICELAKKLITNLANAGIQGIQIDLPMLKHIKKDAERLGFSVYPTVDDMRSRWVLDLGEQLKSWRKEQRNVDRLRNSGVR